jgi:transposase InsO family protein
MKLHANAALSLNQRRRLAKRVNEQGWSAAKVAGTQEVSQPTARKWAHRYASEGEAGLLDRPSAANQVWNRTPDDRIEAICVLRRLRFTGAEIAELLEMPETTVSGILARVGLGRLGRIGLEPPRRYERQRPGELVHVDVKKLGAISGRGAGHRLLGLGHRQSQFKHQGRGVTGWEFVHIAIDDHSRLAYAEVLADQRGETAVAFLRRALRFFASHGICVRRVMTDNGSAYVSKAHAIACRELGLKHLRTQPYRPRTNGKAERFIQTMLREWAYGRLYGTSAERIGVLPLWLDRYNWRRPHGSLGHRPPGSRLTNVAGNYT